MGICITLPATGLFWINLSTYRWKSGRDCPARDCRRGGIGGGQTALLCIPALALPNSTPSMIACHATVKPGQTEVGSDAFLMTYPLPHPSWSIALCYTCLVQHCLDYTKMCKIWFIPLSNLQSYVNKFTIKIRNVNMTTILLPCIYLNHETIYLSSSGN